MKFKNTSSDSLKIIPPKGKFAEWIFDKVFQTLYQEIGFGATGELDLFYNFYLQLKQFAEDFEGVLRVIKRNFEGYIVYRIARLLEQQRECLVEAYKKLVESAENKNPQPTPHHAYFTPREIVDIVVWATNPPFYENSLFAMP